MQIHIDTAVDKPHIIRHAAYLLLAHLGDIDHEPGETPTLPEQQPIEAPPPPPPPPAPAASTDLEVEIPPPPLAPPVAPSASTAPAIISTQTASLAPAATALAPTADGARMTAPAPTLVGSAATSLFDSAGLPWDARIHQSGKSQKKDGTWKLKKGIDQGLVATVVAELVGQKQQAPATVSLFPGPTDAVPLPPESAAAAPAAPVPSAQPAAAAPVPAPATPAPGVTGPTFRDLVAKFTAATKSGALRPDEVQTICQQAGAPNLSSLMSQTALIAQVSDLLDARLLGG